MCTETHTHIITLVVTFEPNCIEAIQSPNPPAVRMQNLVYWFLIWGFLTPDMSSGAHLLLRREPSVCHVRHGEAISARQHTFYLFIIPVQSLTNKPTDAELGCLFTPTDTTEAPADLPSGCWKGDAGIWACMYELSVCLWSCRDR